MKDYMFLWILALSICGALDAQVVTRGQINAQGSSSAVMTINGSGVQQLSSNFTGEIVISASNVTLDLRGFTIFGGTRGVRITGSNVTVQNGTIRDATVGVRIEGNNNQLIGLDFIANTTGVEVVSNNNMIYNCNALNNTSAGFSLVGANRTTVRECSVIDTSGTGNTYGFITHNGTANLFEKCLAERMQTSGVSPLYSAGFVITGTEQQSKILNSQMNDARGSNSYGMRVQGVTLAGYTPLLSELATATFEIGANVNSVAWLAIGTSYYVVVGNDNLASGPEVRVLQFNPVAGILSGLSTATFEIGNNVLSVAWQAVGNSYYVAVGNAAVTGPEVRVLQFNQGTEMLSSLATATFEIGTQVNAVAWQSIVGSLYVAAASNSPANPEVRILLFNQRAGVLSAIISATFDPGVVNANALAWQQIGGSYYLAMGNSAVAGPEVRVLQFNPVAGILASITSATFEIGVDVKAVSWQQIGSSYYVAVGNNVMVGPEVRVLQFNQLAGILTAITSATFEINVDVNSVAWQQIGGSYYLAVGNSGILDRPEVWVLKFNPTTQILSELPSATFANLRVPSVAWQQIGSSYYMTVGNNNLANGPEVRVLKFDDYQRFPLNNIIMQNQSSGNVIGFQDDASVNSLNQWRGNFSANNNLNLSIGTQFPINASSGLGNGVTENLDASLATGGPARKIMATVVDQLTSLTAPMAVKNTVLIAYGITPIVGTTTLTSMKSYCLAADMNGTIFILTSSFITLDLNQHTVGNISVTNSQFLVMRNGRVSPNNGVTDGISFTNSSNILLQNVDVANAQNGLIFANTTGQDSAIMVQNCTFNNNSQIGFRIVNGTYPNKPRDIYCYKCAARNNGSHGFSIGSEGSKYYQCEATNNAGRGFTLENTAVLIGVNNPASTDIHNLFAECVAMNNTGTGFHMQASQSGNVVASCYARGNGGANYSNGVMWGVVTDSTSSVEYWQNYAQPTP